jgi:O-antigen/teichoic acid export membrane protein
LVAAEGTSRVLAFLFFALVARRMSPAEFGVVRLSVLVATIAASAAAALAVLAARDFASTRANPTATGQLRAALLGGLLFSVVGPIAVLGVVGAFFGAGAVDPIGTVVSLAGFAVLQVYYGVCRGVGDIRLAAFSWSGAAAGQLMLWIPAVSFGLAGARTALVVYGASSIAVVALAEVRARLVTRDVGPWARAAVVALVKPGTALLASSSVGLAWTSIDILWVQRRLGAAAVGEYGAARSIGLGLAIVPLALSSYTVPQVAHLATLGSPRAIRWFLIRVCGVSLAVTALLAGVVYISSSWLLTAFYGSAYVGGAGALRVHCAGFIGYGLLGVVSAAAVGLGRIRIHIAAATVALATAVIMLLLVPPTLTSGAWLYVGPQLAATCLAVGLLWRSGPLRSSG